MRYLVKVTSNMKVLKKMHRDVRSAGIFYRSLPPLVPTPLWDYVIMKADVVKMHKSLNPVRYRYYFQWDSIQNYAGAFGGMWRSRVFVIGGYTLLIEDKKMIIMSIKIKVEWFEWFMWGNRMTTWVIRRQNFYIPLRGTHALVDMFEDYWKLEGSKDNCSMMDDMVVIVLI